MESLKNNIWTWSDIKFPLFPVAKGLEGFYEEEGVLFAKTEYGYRILDDRNLKGDSLGLRRIQMLSNLREEFSYLNKRDFKRKILELVQPLPKKLDNFMNLIKYAYTTKYYLDTTGRYFKYKKTKYVPLVYKQILERKLEERAGTVFSVKGVNNWFEVPFKLTPEAKWVGLLKISKSWYIYEICLEKKKSTRRMV